MKITEIIRIAAASIKWRKGRSLIATCGIAIAVAAAVAIPSILDSAMKDWERLVDYSYPNPNIFTVELGMRFSGSMGGSFSTYPLPVFTNEDIDAIRGMEGVEAVYPQWNSGGFLKCNGKSIIAPLPFLIMPDEAINILVPSNRLLEGSVEGRSVILEYDAAMFIFNSTDVIGKNFTILVWGSEISVKVGGVVEKVKPPSIGSWSNLNLKVYIPMELVPNYEHINTYGSLIVIASSKADEARDRLVPLLKDRLKERNVELMGLEVWGLTLKEMKEMVGGMMGGAESFLYVIAGFSLSIGTLVIAVVALSVVHEELHGITVMRVMGASRRDAFLYVMFIATWIGILGIVIGLVFSLAASYLLITAFQLGAFTLPDLGRVIIAILLSLVVSALAGVYPAYRVSKMDPALMLSRVG
ncbi:MAG: ABC transporter permease [Thermoproteota archaeon]